MSKIKSRKLWIVIWACLTISAICFFSIKMQFDGSWMPGLLAVLAAIPVGYVSIGMAKKTGEEK